MEEVIQVQVTICFMLLIGVLSFSCGGEKERKSLQKKFISFLKANDLIAFHPITGKIINKKTGDEIDFISHEVAIEEMKKP